MKIFGSIPGLGTVDWGCRKVHIFGKIFPYNEFFYHRRFSVDTLVIGIGDCGNFVQKIFDFGERKALIVNFTRSAIFIRGDRGFLS